MLIVKPTVNSLFLSQLGAKHLPYGYLLVALIAVVTSYFYNKAIRKISLLKVIIFSLTIFSIAFVTLSVLLHTSMINDWVLYIYYLGVSLFAVISTSQFWVLANMVYNSREGKRLFGFIGAGGIAGGIFGGYLTSVIVSSYGNKTVMVLAAILLLCCIPILEKVWKLRVKTMNLYVRKQRTFNETNVQETSLRVVFKSKHLTYLALITGISVIVAKLVDYQFSDFASAAIKNSEKLTAFFGFWFSTFNLVALTLQLFFTNRMLSKLGVSSTLLILPLGIALSSLLFLTFPELWVLILIKGIDGSLKQSLNKAAFELSIMPIPLSIKNQAKSYIDVVVDSIATGLSGFILIFLIKRLHLDTSYIIIIVLFFVFIWIFLIYKLRETYYDSFRQNILSTIVKAKKTNKEKQRPENTILTARHILNGKDEKAILNLLDRLSDYKMRALKSSIISLLEYPSNKVKVEAIKHLNVYGKGAEIEKVKTLIYEKNDKLVLTALEYVLNNSSLSRSEFIKNYLNNNNDYIANAALLCLARETADNEKLAAKFDLKNRITEKINEINHPTLNIREEAIVELLITVAYAKEEVHYFYIEKHLKNNNVNIKKQAIKAAGITNNEYFIEPLLELLSEKEYEKNVIKALKRYGSEITTTVLNLDKSEELKSNTKRFIPKILGSFKTQNAVNVLLRLMKDNNSNTRLQASMSLLRLSSKQVELVFSFRIIKNLILKEAKYFRDSLKIILILRKKIAEQPNEIVEDNDAQMELINARQDIIDVLEEQLVSSLKTSFNLLAIIYEENDIKMAHDGLFSNVKEAKINALEFLDNLLKGQLKFKLVPLLEYFTAEGDYSQIINEGALDEKDCLRVLMKSRGVHTKMKILHLIKILNDKGYVPLIKPLKKHRNNDVRYATIQILKKLNK
ncbi:MFS transporter [Tenacibaculum adriaticum]|uniref:MFS transporter n=1 Tax=Tenacibaculum adriaticum TaxID=413713 RepID=UPI001FE3345D|nr:MFS transporter [Tenacibaculum adriaticum]